MESFKRNQTTAEQARKVEDGEINPLTKKPFSAKYRQLLGVRRQLLVYGKREEFLDVYHKARVLLVTSETGSGKTTQIPQFVLYDEFDSGMKIVCTQPRRLAATSVARRVAEEMDVALGKEVGYSVRFDSQSDDKTRLKYVTDGLLLREILNDRSMSRYSCIIIDEAHERTVATDLLMAILKETLRLRQDFKVIIMSATLDATKFQSYFRDAPLLHIPGRAYPVETRYLKGGSSNILYQVLNTVKYIHENQAKGDILVFLPGEDEIECACMDIRKNTSMLDVMPLYSALSMQEQQRVFSSFTNRKCIVATNIAETSLTIDGIVYVVDSGLAKERNHNPRACLETLQVAPISQAAANQRAGRAGRTQPGKCFRLYGEKEFNTVLLKSTKPGILRDNARSTILQVMLVNKDILAFDFIDRPHPEIFLRAIGELVDWNFIDNGEITLSGRTAATFPLDPMWYHAIMVAQEIGCGADMTAIAAVSSTQQSIFHRPHPHQTVANLARTQFAHPLSDHITYLNAFHAFVVAKRGEKVDMDQWCFDHFLRRQALEEASQIRLQLQDELERRMRAHLTRTPFSNPNYFTNIRRALALGLFNQSAIKVKSKNSLGARTGVGLYKTTHQNQHALLRPESTLIDGDHEWVVYSSFEQSGRQYLSTATAIDPAWIVELPYFQDDMLLKTFGTDEFKQNYVKNSLDQARERIQKS